MKKTFLIIAALLCCCFALRAQDFTYEGLNYRVTGTNPPTVKLTGHTEGFAAHDFVTPSTVTYEGTTNSVTSIGNGAFYNCSGLTGSLTIPSSVESIGDQAFQGCSGFNGSLTIGNSVTSIGNYAFDGCSGLTGSLTIPNSVTSIGENAFAHCSRFTGSLTIPNSVTSIGRYAFFGCSGFTGTLSISSSVTSIGEYAFYGCSGFTGTFSIPNLVTRIGKCAFFGCSGFTGTLIIGSSVTNVEYRAFGETKFTQIIAKPTTPPQLETDDVFFNVPIESIEVECDLVNAYQEANRWNVFSELFTGAVLLTVSSSDESAGSASIDVMPDCDDPSASRPATVLATPSNGYRFLYWTKDGVVVSHDNPYTFTYQVPTDLVANFRIGFGCVCSTGQMLYYEVVDAERHWVKIVPPDGENRNGWNGFDKPSGEIVLPETIEFDGTSYTVTEIGDYAFYACGDLTGSLNIPNSVTSIGASAFASCSGFNGSLTIGNSVKSIGASAFESCSGFNGSLTIGNSVTSIGNGAFGNCSGFRSLSVPNSLTSIGDRAFVGCTGFTGSLTIPNSVKSIGASAFESCSGFTGSLTIGSSVESIGKRAFYQCSGFTGTLTIGNSVKCIGDDAFGSCSGFTGPLCIPNSVESIGASAFAGCSGFTGTLTIGNSVKCIGNGAFGSCSGFTGTLCIPNSVESIGASAFGSCSGFTGSLDIPNSVESIGTYAFYQCSGFTGSLSIGNSVTSIEVWTFAGCSGFNGLLTIGSSVTSIGTYAFAYTNFTQIIARPTTPPNVDGMGLFFNSSPSVTVPCGCGDAYKNKDGWKAFADRTTEDFVRYEFTVMSANPLLGMASITQSGTCEDSHVSATAIPAENCTFTGWTENGVHVSTDNPYTFTLGSDCNLVANFTKPPYEPIMSLPSPVNPDAVYVLGYQDGDNYYLHTSGSAPRKMQLSLNPANPVEYRFNSMQSGGSTLTYAFSGSLANTLHIDTEDVSLAAFDPMGTTEPFSLSIANGDISSAAAPNYIVGYYRVNGIPYICVRNQSQRLYFFFKGILLNIALSTSPEGAGTVTATCGGKPVESAFEGKEITVTATSVGGYRFMNWTENGVVVSAENPYTFTLERDRNLVANFFRNYDFSATCATGQTLYYRITDTEQNLVGIVAPNSDDGMGWNGFTKPEGDIILPETVEHNGTSYTVTEIGAFAFFDCSGLTGPLAIPNTVRSIGDEAFSVCPGLNGTLVIGSSVTSIGYGAFSNAGFTQIIARPTTPPQLGRNAFSNVPVESIEVECNLVNAYQEAAGWSDFSELLTGSVLLTVSSSDESAGMASIDVTPDCDDRSATVSATPASGFAFIKWTKDGTTVSYDNPYTFTCQTPADLVANFRIGSVCSTGQMLYYEIVDDERHWVKIVPPNGENASGWNGFEKPKGEIVLPEFIEAGGIRYTVTGIGDCAFYSCNGLTGSLRIPNSVTTIEGSAFQACSGFTGSLTIGGSVESIGNFAFAGCSGFTGSLTIPNSVTNIGIYAFEDCPRFTGSLTIGNSMESIGDGVFYECSGFTGTLTIPNSVTSIGENAFAYCSRFTGTLTIPNSVTSIGKDAFYRCSGLTGSLTIGNAMTSIGKDAFLDCHFTNIISKAQTAPSLGSKIPDATNKVYIPKNTTYSYQSAWAGHGYTFIEYDREDYHFNGTGSEWNTAANWEENEVPFMPCHNAYVNANCIFNATGNNAALHSVNVAEGITLTIAESKTLTADLITLEDGAQLINNNGTVACNDLTVKKDIEGYGEGAGNWNLVSSPVATTSLPMGMKADPADDYDLYRFSQTGDEEGHEWLNYKAETFGIENLSGYLYANKNNRTIVFHGNFASTETKTLAYYANADFPGFNLVGNPYPCNAYLADGRSFYRMNESGTELIVDNTNPAIAPCEGVFVQAQSTGESITFTSTAPSATCSLPTATVAFTLSQGRSAAAIDRAIVRLGKGDVLGKLMLNADGTRLYIPQDGKDFAVVSTSSTCGEMPLNFKAAKNGTYTISVNTENVDAEYLHLIDNLTGNDVDLLATEGDVARNVSTYTFDAKTSDYASRFKLVFGVKDDTSAGSVSESFAYISNGEIVISNEGRATLQVIDVLGRIVSSEEINGECRISTNGLTAGLYILNLNGMTQKIVVK